MRYILDDIAKLNEKTWLPTILGTFDNEMKYSYTRPYTYPSFNKNIAPNTRIRRTQDRTPPPTLSPDETSHSGNRRKRDMGNERKLSNRERELNQCRIITADGKVEDCESPKEVHSGRLLWRERRQEQYRIESILQRRRLPTPETDTEDERETPPQNIRLARIKLTIH